MEGFVDQAVAFKFQQHEKTLEHITSYMDHISIRVDSLKGLHKKMANLEHHIDQKAERLQKIVRELEATKINRQEVEASLNLKVNKNEMEEWMVVTNDLQDKLIQLDSKLVQLQDKVEKNAQLQTHAMTEISNDVACRLTYEDFLALQMPIKNRMKAFAFALKKLKTMIEEDRNANYICATSKNFFGRGDPEAKCLCCGRLVVTSKKIFKFPKREFSIPTIRPQWKPESHSRCYECDNHSAGLIKNNNLSGSPKDAKSQSSTQDSVSSKEFQHPIIPEELCDQSIISEEIQQQPTIPEEFQQQLTIPEDIQQQLPIPEEFQQQPIIPDKMQHPVTSDDSDQSGSITQNIINTGRKEIIVHFPRIDVESIHEVKSEPIVTKSQSSKNSSVRLTSSVHDISNKKPKLEPEASSNKSENNVLQSTMVISTSEEDNDKGLDTDGLKTNDVSFDDSQIPKDFQIGPKKYWLLGQRKPTPKAKVKPPIAGPLLLPPLAVRPCGGLHTLTGPLSRGLRFEKFRSPPKLAEYEVFLQGTDNNMYIGMETSAAKDIRKVKLDLRYEDRVSDDLDVNSPTWKDIFDVTPFLQLATVPTPRFCGGRHTMIKRSARQKQMNSTSPQLYLTGHNKYPNQSPKVKNVFEEPPPGFDVEAVNWNEVYDFNSVPKVDAKMRSRYCGGVHTTMSELRGRPRNLR